MTRSKALALTFLLLASIGSNSSANAGILTDAAKGIASRAVERLDDRRSSGQGQVNRASAQRKLDLSWMKKYELCRKQMAWAATWQVPKHQQAAMHAKGERMCDKEFNLD